MIVWPLILMMILLPFRCCRCSSPSLLFCRPHPRSQEGSATDGEWEDSEDDWEPPADPTRAAPRESETAASDYGPSEGDSSSDDDDGDWTDQFPYEQNLFR
jgi:hypothetical protein